MSKQKEGKVVMDIDAILDFVFAPNEKRNTDIELEETFVPGDDEDGEIDTSSPLRIIQRIKHEVKNGERAQHEAIRVNLISRLLDSVDGLNVESGEVVGDMSFGEEVSYNTLFNYGFLKLI